MQKFNYHTHTYRCGHAIGTDEEYILAAIKAGYKILGFSDHSPYKDYPLPGTHMDWSLLDNYIETITSLKEKYKDQIDIKIGLESEYYDYCHEEKVYLRNRLDYLILGQHFSDPQAIKTNYFSNNSDQEILDYGDDVCKALDTGLFMYLCHPDVFMCRQPSFSEACQITAHKIAKKCAETNTPVEFNIHNIRRGKFQYDTGYRYFYPNYDFWKILAQYPLQVIIGIDAHDPNDLLRFQDIEDGLNEVKDLNLNFIKEPII